MFCICLSLGVFLVSFLLFLGVVVVFFLVGCFPVEGLHFSSAKALRVDLLSRKTKGIIFLLQILMQKVFSFIKLPFQASKQMLKSHTMEEIYDIL